MIAVVGQPHSLPTAPISIANSAMPPAVKYAGMRPPGCERVACGSAGGVCVCVCGGGGRQDTPTTSSGRQLGGGCRRGHQNHHDRQAARPRAHPGRALHARRNLARRSLRGAEGNVVRRVARCHDAGHQLPEARGGGLHGGEVGGERGVLFRCSKARSSTALREPLRPLTRPAPRSARPETTPACWVGSQS